MLSRKPFWRRNSPPPNKKGTPEDSLLVASYHIDESCPDYGDGHPLWSLWHRRWAALLACCIVGALLLTQSYASPPQDKFMGVGSCSSSNCHGSVNPIKGSKVLQNEYHTWLKHDEHSQAFAALTTADGRRMADLMGLQDPTKEPLCLKCHATYVPEATLRGPKYSLEDGVSCESCHGAAERWLSSHTEAGATHQQNVRNGLAEIAPLDKRATLCLSCHFGNEEKSVTHDLYGAGHPRLRFELDTFGILQPKHWIVDDDYIKRKGPYVPLSAWFIGQAYHAQETVKAIASPNRSKSGAFPELSLFDCFSCHHNLSDEQWKEQTYNGEPGRLRLNLAPLIMLQETLGALDMTVAGELRALVSELHTTHQRGQATESLASLASLLNDRVIPLVTRIDPTPATCARVLRALAEYGVKNPFPKYEVAEQIGMGLQAVLATSPDLAKSHQARLDGVFETLKDARTFKPSSFTKATAELLELVSKKGS